MVCSLSAVRGMDTGHQVYTRPLLYSIGIVGTIAVVHRSGYFQQCYGSAACMGGLYRACQQTILDCGDCRGPPPYASDFLK